MELSLSVGIPGTVEYGLDLHIEIGSAARHEREVLADVLNSIWGTSRLPDSAEWFLPLESKQRLTNCLQWIAGALWALAAHPPNTPPPRLAVFPNTRRQTAQQDESFEEDA